MNWLGIAARDVRVQRLRYTLTGITMVLGVLALVGVALAGGTVSDALVAQEEQQHGRAVSVSAQVDPESDPNSLRRFAVELHRVEGTSGSAGILATGWVNANSAPASEGRAGEPLAVTWIDGERATLFRMPVAEYESDGESNLSPQNSDLPLPPQVQLNEAAAQQLGVKPGEQVSLKPTGAGGQDGVGFGPGAGAVFRVSGIVSDGADDAAGYGSFAAFAELFPGAADHSRIEARIVGPGVGVALLAQAIRDSAERSGVKLVSAPSRVDSVAELQAQLDLIRVVFNGVAAVLLLVAALGIANVGISSVRERAYELSVRRAIGARPVDVFAQMLGAAGIVGVMVSVIAVVGAIAATYLLMPVMVPQAMAIQRPSFPWPACFTGILSAIGVSLLGGLVPAIAATRIPVAAALRN